MKKTNAFLLIFISSLFIACASNNTAELYDNDEYDYRENLIVPIVEITDNFIGDFDPTEIEGLMFLQKSKKTLKPKEVKDVILIPRTNCVELSFRDEVNTVTIELSKYERDKILESCKTFIDQYDSKTLPHHKINSKTAYVKSKCKFWFGVFASSNQCSDCDYYTNCEFIEKRPYFLLKFLASQCDDGKAYTPKLSLYMSPTQVRAFINQMDQETLNAYVKDLNEKAYTY